MKRGRFSAERIIGALREQEGGASVAEVCGKQGMSSAASFMWKSRYAGMGVSDAKRRKATEAVNAELQRLYADAMLDSPEDHESIQWTDLARDRAQGSAVKKR